MTRRDYETLALSLRESYINPPSGEFADTFNRGVWHAACAMGRALKLANPRFDEDRWSAATAAPMDSGNHNTDEVTA